MGRRTRSALQAITTHLRTALPAAGLGPVAVTTVVPNPRPDLLVTAETVGTYRVTAAHTRTDVLLTVWAPTPDTAEDLALDVYDIASALDDDGAWIPAADGWVGGPAYLEDPVTGTPRYVMTCSVQMRDDHPHPRKAPS